MWTKRTIRKLAALGSVCALAACSSEPPPQTAFTTAWVALGTGRSSVPLDVAVAKDGSVLLTGHVEGQVGFGKTTLFLAWRVPFVARLDAGGQFTWALAMDVALQGSGASVAVDSDGNAYVAGDFSQVGSSAAAIGPLKLQSAGGYDCFVLKLSPAGTPVWASVLGSTGNDGCGHLVLAASGQIHVSGTYGAAMTLGASSLPAPTSYIQPFIATLDRDGKVLRAAHIASDCYLWGVPLAVTGAGEVVVAARVLAPTEASCSIRTGATQLTTKKAASAVLLARLDPLLSWKGAQLVAEATGRWEDYALAVPTALAPGPQGTVHVAGHFGCRVSMGTTSPCGVQLGSTALTSRGGSDLFVTRLGADGKPVWAVSGGGFRSEAAEDLVVDAAGNSFIAGSFASEAISARHGSALNAGSWDVLVAKLSPAGELLWAASAGGTGFDLAVAVALDPRGGIVVAGNVDGPATVGNAYHQTDGSDLFVWKLVENAP